MRLIMVPMMAILAALAFWPKAGAQESPDREIMLHQNVKLTEVAAKASIPAALSSQYRKFLPTFEEVLKANTQDHTDEKRLVIRVEAGVKEIGSAKTKRAVALVTAFCRNSRREFVGSLILHSYVTNGPVNKEEIEQFLRKQILEHLVCYVPTKPVFTPAEETHAPTAVPAEVKPLAPQKAEPKLEPDIEDKSSSPPE